MWKFYEMGIFPAAILAMLALILYFAATDPAPPPEVPPADPSAVYENVRSLLIDEGAEILEAKKTERSGFIVVRFADEDGGDEARGPLGRFKRRYADLAPPLVLTVFRETETSIDLDYGGVDVFAVEVADRLLISVGR